LGTIDRPPAVTRALQPNERTRVLAEYLPTLLFLIVATGIGIVLIVVGNVLGPKSPSADKLAPYECGFSAFELPLCQKCRQRHSSKPTARLAQERTTIQRQRRLAVTRSSRSTLSRRASSPTREMADTSTGHTTATLTTGMAVTSNSTHHLNLLLPLRSPLRRSSERP
jgi:hypothetical protein